MDTFRSQQLLVPSHGNAWRVSKLHLSLLSCELRYERICFALIWTLFSDRRNFRLIGRHPWSQHIQPEFGLGAALFLLI